MSRRTSSSNRLNQANYVDMIRDNPATFGIFLACLLVFLLDVLSCFIVGPCHLLILLFAQANQLVWQGQLWRLFTAMFVHGDIIHLLSNMLFLLVYGLRLEELKGSRWVLFIFLVSALAGNILSLFLMRPEIISLGASGGIFGILGALLVLLARMYPSQAKAMAFLAIIFFIITIGINTNIFSHFGGLITGAVIMYLELKLQGRKKKIKSVHYR